MHKCKKTTTQRTICYLKTEKEWTANAQNSTFASPDTQTDTAACKRAVFLPTHPSPPTTLTQYEWISREKRVDNNIKF
ncbi:MAG: hypothetical protein GX292_08530 [Bacteroidales bacterium]|nr:hypothetical protein [Bacteroidales bacterium]